jgi:hypothetical protein
MGTIAQQPLGNIFDIVEGFPTVDLQTGANTGDYVSLVNCEGVLVLFRSGVGTAADDPTITTQWTVVTQAAANTYTEATAAEQDVMWCIWVPADSLRDGASHIRATVADVGGNAQPGDLLYIIVGPNYMTAPDATPSYVA